MNAANDVLIRLDGVTKVFYTDEVETHALAGIHLEIRNGESVMQLLQELHRAGATIAMVTHDPRYARHADRSIHLFDGRIVEENVAEAV